MDIPKVEPEETESKEIENVPEVIAEKIRELNSTKSHCTIELTKVIDHKIIEEIEEKGYIVDYFCFRSKSKQMVNSITITNPKFTKKNDI